MTDAKGQQLGRCKWSHLTPRISLYTLRVKPNLLNRRGTNRRIFDVCAKNAIGAKQQQLRRRRHDLPLHSAQFGAKAAKTHQNIQHQ